MKVHYVSAWSLGKGNSALSVNPGKEIDPSFYGHFPVLIFHAKA